MKKNNFTHKDYSINSEMQDNPSIDYEEESLLDLLPEANPIPPKIFEDSKEIKIAFNYKLLDSPTFHGLSLDKQILSQYALQKN